MKDLMLLTREEYERNFKTHKWYTTHENKILCLKCGWVRVFDGFSHITPYCNEYKMDSALK